MKIYKVKFKSGIEALVRSNDLSEAADVHGEIELVESTHLAIFEGRMTRYYNIMPAQAFEAEPIKTLPDHSEK